MKYIFITYSFEKHVKKFKRYFMSDDVVSDVEWFVKRGVKAGESFLEESDKFGVMIKYYKLRLTVNSVDFRYIVGVVGDVDYIPFVIDLKKGQYGRNLSFNASKETQRFINNALDGSLYDYLNNSEENETATIYEVEI